MRCWNHKVENFHKDLKKIFYKSRVWLGTERPSTFTFHPRLIFVLRSHNSMPIRCWHKVRNFYKETGKLSKRLFDLRWSFLTTFTKARIHNMWQECKNVAMIFQREGGSNKWNSPDCQVDLHAVFTRKDPHLQNIPWVTLNRENRISIVPQWQENVWQENVGCHGHPRVKNRVENWENSKRTLTYPHTVLPHEVCQPLQSNNLWLN